MIQSNANNLIKTYTFTVTFNDLSPSEQITISPTADSYSITPSGKDIGDTLKVSPQYSISSVITPEAAQSLAVIGKGSHILDLRYVTEGASESFTLYPKTSYEKGLTFSTIERVQQITNAPNHIYINLININDASITVYAMYNNSCITKSANIPDALMTGKTVTFMLNYL